MITDEWFLDEYSALRKDVVLLNFAAVIVNV